MSEIREVLRARSLPLQRCDWRSFFAFLLETQEVEAISHRW